MARITLAESKFNLISEGTKIFKVVEVDDSKLADFGKLVVKLQTSKGEKHSETYTLKKNNVINQGALKAWSYFARTCLGDFSADEIDTQDIVGCFVQATVKHEKYEATKGEKAGQEMTSVRLNDLAMASGFTTKPAENIDELDDQEDQSDDDFLNS